MSYSTSNYLNIPRSDFGTSGINTGDIIYGNLQSGEMKYNVQYDSINRRVIVLNSSDLSANVLDKILYSKSSLVSYDGWFPKVKKKRDEDGNLLIKFSCFHPHHSRPSLIDSEIGMESFPIRFNTTTSQWFLPEIHDTFLKTDLNLFTKPSLSHFY